MIKYDSNYDNKIELLFFKLAVNLNRIFPIKFKKISKNDGILRLRNNIDFLKSDYKKIFNLSKLSIDSNGLLWSTNITSAPSGIESITLGASIPK